MMMVMMVMGWGSGGSVGMGMGWECGWNGEERCVLHVHLECVCSRESVWWLGLRRTLD